MCYCKKILYHFLRHKQIGLRAFYKEIYDKPDDGKPFLHDGARAQKADAADDLRCDARGVCAGPVPNIHRDHHDKAGAETDEDVRPQPRRLVPGFTLITDQAAQYAGKQQFAEYFLQPHDMLANASSRAALLSLLLL